MIKHFAICLLCLSAAWMCGAGAMTVVRVSEEALVEDVVPFGVNIGAPEPYGANQILDNLILNPGFEAGVFGMVFHVDEGATGRRVPQAFWDSAWNNDEHGVGHPAGFWDGAEFEIVYGTAKGRRGKVERFAIEGGKPVFHLDSDGPAPGKWDVVFVRRDGVACGIGGEPAAGRPGSPGNQSLRLVQPADWKPAFAYYADSVWRDSDVSAGKLFVVRGDWRLEFWAKGGKGGEQLQAVFKREGETEFFNRTFSLAPEWKKYEALFSVGDTADAGGPRGILMFGFYVPQAGAEVWVDDLALYRPSDDGTAFTAAVVRRLKEFRPGVLRFWAEQLGDTLANQLAEPFSRRPHGYKPHSRQAWMYTYSLPEFLVLCREVGAEPWYVIPPTFSAEDLAGLAAYLAAPKGAHPYADLREKLGQAAPWTDVFGRIHLEYGNEMWGAASGGDPFMGASALGGERYGSIAQDRLALVRGSEFFNGERMNLVAGAQTFAPSTQRAIATSCSTADAFAFAPYFGILEKWESAEDLYGPLFAAPFYEAASGHMRQNWDIISAGGTPAPQFAGGTPAPQFAGGTPAPQFAGGTPAPQFAGGTPAPQSVIYEINFHTTDGAAPEEVRNAFVAGASGAVVLPLAMLVYQRELGITRQCAFTAAQYAFRAGNGQNVRLWGLLRDLEGSGRKRPTWLGVELVNQAVLGTALKTFQEGANPQRVQAPLNGIETAVSYSLIQSFGFRDGRANSAVLFNLGLDEAQDVELRMPREPANTARHSWIAPKRLDDTNEERETVKIEEAELRDFSGTYRLTLEPHSVHVLRWEDKE